MHHGHISVGISCDLTKRPTFPYQPDHHSPRKVVCLLEMPPLTAAWHSVLYMFLVTQDKHFYDYFPLRNHGTKLAIRQLLFPFILRHVRSRATHLTSLA
ncbi:hypothetical protein TNCV_4245351 [Trichonephila clavipes]|nr:hypothetical protein TNCV_4245351 [Trichonephila clavipes]